MKTLTYSLGKFRLTGVSSTTLGLTKHKLISSGHYQYLLDSQMVSKHKHLSLDLQRIGGSNQTRWLDKAQKLSLKLSSFAINSWETAATDSPCWHTAVCTMRALHHE